MKHSDIELNSEVRHLPRQVVSELGNILQLDHSWKDIMGIIPDKPWTTGNSLPERNYLKKYSAEDIRLIADECSKDGRTGFEVLVEEWGTSGIIRPKVLDLIHLLKRAGLERAASYIEILIYGDTERISSSKEIVISSEIIEPRFEICMSQITDGELLADETYRAGLLKREDFKNINIPFIPFDDLRNSIESGGRIGEGAFGFVYKAQVKLDDEEMTVAVKVLSDCNEEAKQLLKKETVFKNEIDTLALCDHKNIITLEAYSFSRSEMGLVYSFMKNGSLYDRLSCSGGSPPLPWEARLNIAEGAAEGIVYLHTRFNPPMVHRDIKSPNILLDENFVPKLGDFGIVRMGSRAIHTSTVIRTTPIGTQMYMAPEAFRGDVSVKMDTFSFAIVILELLTGLPYFDEERENRDILSHVEEYEGDEVDLLDSSAGDWDILIGKKMFEFSEICTKDKKDRPDMVQALTLLRNIIYHEESVL